MIQKLTMKERAFYNKTIHFYHITNSVLSGRWRPSQPLKNASLRFPAPTVPSRATKPFTASSPASSHKCIRPMEFLRKFSWYQKKNMFLLFTKNGANLGTMDWFTATTFDVHPVSHFSFNVLPFLELHHHQPGFVTYELLLGGILLTLKQPSHNLSKTDQSVFLEYSLIRSFIQREIWLTNLNRKILGSNWWMINIGSLLLVFCEEKRSDILWYCHVAFQLVFSHLFACSKNVLSGQHVIKAACWKNGGI